MTDNDNDRILIDVEEPGRDPWTISLAEAIADYYLGADDIEQLKAGEIVWYRRDTAITLHTDE